MRTDGLAAEQERGELNLDYLILELDAAIDFLPVDALRRCQLHREQITPRLIKVLQEAARLGREGIVREGNAHFFALFLLTEFQATEALPVVLDLFSLRDPVLDGLFSDAITEVGWRVLAVLGADQPDLLEAMISDRQLDDYVRWATAGALVGLVRDGRSTREEAVERLARQMRKAMAADDHWGVTITVDELADLNPIEVEDEIKAAFERGQVDESIISWDYIDKKSLDPLHPGICPSFDYRKPSAIEDTVEELRGWHCFSEEYRNLRASWRDKERKERDADEFWDDEAVLGDFEKETDEESDFSFGPSYASSMTIRNESRRVGRNDLCPCGSGKKYKKCCMRKGKEVSFGE